MHLSVSKLAVVAACAALILSAGTAGAGMLVVEPVEPPLAVPFASGGPTVAESLDAANSFAIQTLAQGVPPLTAAQRAAALAQLAEIIAASGGSHELDALVAAVNAAPAGD